MSSLFSVSRRTIHLWIEFGQFDMDTEAGAAWRKLYPYKEIIRDRLGGFPKLGAQRLLEEIRSTG